MGHASYINRRRLPQSDRVHIRLRITFHGYSNFRSIQRSISSASSFERQSSVVKKPATPEMAVTNDLGKMGALSSVTCYPPLSLGVWPQYTIIRSPPRGPAIESS